MAQEQDDINLSNQELQVLSELDSRQFGFLKLNTPEQVKKKELVLKAVKYLERMLVQAQSQKDQQELSAGKEINIDPKTYCKLGHFHLLLEDYTKAMSAYQKFFGLKSDYWKDATFLYGQGLVYFHFNAFQWRSGHGFEVKLFPDVSSATAADIFRRLSIAEDSQQLRSQLQQYSVS